MLDKLSYVPFGLEPIERASRDEIAGLQTARLKHTLRLAYDNVPAYRAKFDAAGVSPDDLRTLDDIAKFPFTTKQDLRANYPFGMFAVPREQIVRIHASSGTTGKPTVVGYTANDIDTWSNLMARSIRAAGGRAMASAASVTDPAAVRAMVDAALAEWGRIDILVNNAGILRDKSFAKMELADFRLVLDVHLMGAVHCCQAVWEPMRSRGFGRIVMTTSSSGLYGNFGQSNYGAAKMALVGLMQTLSIEGAKHDIRVNCLAPTAATRMTEGLMPQAVLERLGPESVTPGLLALVADDAPNRTILCAGAGAFEAAHVTLTRGIHVGTGADAAERVLDAIADIADRDGETVPANGSAQGTREIEKAMRAADRNA